MKKITIAVDGYSSTGKSTLSRQLAQKLGYTYIDTGAMYRAVTLFAIENKLVGGEKQNLPALVQLLPYIQLEFRFNDRTKLAEMYLDNRNVEQAIRSPEVSNHVSMVAAVPEVRRKLVDMQRKMGKGKGVVMDGRDIGTVVFPDAELKLFLTASPEVRAQRRYKELLQKGHDISYGEVLKNIRERDYTDSHRKEGPLAKAPDAIVIDNSDMSLQDQFDRMYHFALRIVEE
ncbi:MAG: (d)CMP kinase [Sinomicrobium sp.]|nr:(d)CMP kinase [Sinomicrobium sp.]